MFDSAGNDLSLIIHEAVALTASSHTINIKIRKTMSLYQSVGLIVLRIRIILSCSTIDSSNYSVWAGTFSTAD